MSKPSWATYLARDRFGAWNWYSEHPIMGDEDDDIWFAPNPIKHQTAYSPLDDESWRESLEARP